MAVYGRSIIQISHYSPEEKSEIGRGMKQSASGLLLRNWMEVRNIFIKYLYTRESSPYNRSDDFSRDEYQSDIGNLPHMHMMISMDTLNMSDKEMGNPRIYSVISSLYCPLR